jgi:hypothetical protein
MIYICGPLTDENPAKQQANIDAATNMYKQLVIERCLAFCPHLSAYVPGAFDMSYETWMQQDLEIIRLRATNLLLLPGWEFSDGPKRELIQAIRITLPVFTDYRNAVAHYHKICGAVPL